MKKRAVTILLAGLLGLGLVTATPAGAGDNAAIAINTKDGGTVFKVAFAIRRVMSGVVDQSNGAVAYASCTDCTTVAIAIEVVLVESNPTVVTPTNIAFAYNEFCSLCLTVADAYQFVLGTGGTVHFDAEGNRTLAEIKNELERLKHETLTLAELQARLESMIARLQDVLANHLAPTGKPAEPTTTQTTTATTTTTAPTVTQTTTTGETTTESTTSTTAPTTTSGS
jgi:putative peptide zinc metalloprotease protein